MNISCALSIGEFLDKVSILLIKIQKIKEEDKQNNCKKELEILMPFITDELMHHLQLLVEVNEKLYEVIQNQHNKVKNNDFGEEFVQDAKKIYELNNNRYKLKNDINQKFKSDIVEEKSIGS